MATIGAAVLTSMVAASRVMPAEPTAEADQGDDDRQPGADDRAEGQHQDQQRGDDADQLAAAAHRGGGGVGQVAAELDLDPGVTGGADGLVERREVLEQVVVGHRRVVLHGEQGGVAVRAQPRRRRPRRRGPSPRAARSAERSRRRRPASRRGCARRRGRWRCRRRGCARAAGRCRPGRGRRGCPSCPGGCRRCCRRGRRRRRRPATQAEIVRQGWAAVERPRRWRRRDMVIGPSSRR